MVLDGEAYLVRLHLVKSPWFAVMLHWIARPDPQPDPHDHPVTFLSLVLRGGYAEERHRKRGVDHHRVRWLNWLRARDVHRITWVAPGTLTLALAGPVTREWGFHTPVGWVSWRKYGTPAERGYLVQRR